MRIFTPTIYRWNWKDGEWKLPGGIRCGGNYADVVLWRVEAWNLTSGAGRLLIEFGGLHHNTAPSLLFDVSMFVNDGSDIIACGDDPSLISPFEAGLNVRQFIFFPHGHFSDAVIKCFKKLLKELKIEPPVPGLSVEVLPSVVFFGKKPGVATSFGNYLEYRHGLSKIITGIVLDPKFVDA